MDQYFVSTYGFQMKETREHVLREDASPEEVARRGLEHTKAFRNPNYYEPICFGDGRGAGRPRPGDRWGS
eukprot:1182395-Alexandrium_andersonii.AAC.1